MNFYISIRFENNYKMGHSAYIIRFYNFSGSFMLLLNEIKWYEVVEKLGQMFMDFYAYRMVFKKV